MSSSSWDPLAPGGGLGGVVIIQVSHLTSGGDTVGRGYMGGPILLPVAGLRRVLVPEFPSFSVENPESWTVLPVELPSGDFLSRRTLGMLPVFGLGTFHECGMSSDMSGSGLPTLGKFLLPSSGICGMPKPDIFLCK